MKKTAMRPALHILLSSVLIVGASLTPAQPAAGTPACEGNSCTGLDPSGKCDGDAITVASIAVENIGVPYESASYPGQLDLRYSPSCKANWERFTIYRHFLINAITNTPTPLWGNTWAWNPGDHSQGPVDGNMPTAPGITSTWTKMIDGTKTACVGVRVFWISEQNDPQKPNSPTTQSADWTWGPCV